MSFTLHGLLSLFSILIQPVVLQEPLCPFTPIKHVKLGFRYHILFPETNQVSSDWPKGAHYIHSHLVNFVFFFTSVTSWRTLGADVSLLHGFGVYEVVRVAFLHVAQPVGLFIPVTRHKQTRYATRTTSLTLKATQERNLCSQGSRGAFLGVVTYQTVISSTR